MNIKSIYCLSERLLTTLLLFWLGLTLSVAMAASEAGKTANSAPTQLVGKASLQARIDLVKKREDLNDEQKSKLLSTYQTAVDNLNRIDDYRQQAAVFKKSVKAAPEQTRVLLKNIDTSQAKAEDFTRIQSAELEQRLILEREKLSELDENTRKAETELALQTDRQQKIREEMASTRLEIDDTRNRLESLTSRLDSKLEIETTQIVLASQVDAGMAELDMLEAEALSSPVRIELIKTQLQWFEVQKNQQNLVITAIENVLSERRQQEALQIRHALSEAEKEMSGKHPLIQQVTRENIQYSRDLQKLTVNIEKYGELRNRIDAKSSDIDNDYKSAEKKIGLAGLSPALGRILREQRRNLVSQGQDAKQVENIQKETASTSLAQLGVEEKLKGLVDVDAYLSELMKAMVDPALAMKSRMMIQAELRILVNNQKDVLNKLSIANAGYLRILGDVDFARQQLQVKAQKFNEYLDERLLWVPSSEPVNKGFVIGFYQSLRWLLAPLNWRVLLGDSVSLALNHPFLTTLGLLTLLFLRSGRHWAKRQLAGISEKVGKLYTDNFEHTWKALAYTVVLDLPLPLLIFWYGWLLNGDFQADVFSKAIGEGFKGAATPLFILQLFYRLFAPEGIAVRHFQWQQSNADLLRREIAWVRFVAIPGVFLINATANSDNTLYGDCLGRVALILVMGGMAIFFGRLLKPKNGLLTNHLQSWPNGWTQRLLYVWYPAVILIPLIVVGFAVSGYYLSALELEQKLVVTIRWAFFLIVLYELVIRWLTLVNRQLALKNARQKRKTASQVEKSVGIGGEDPVIPIDEQLIDIPKINAQTIKLLNVFTAFSVFAGVWIIWENILPAFSFLEHIELWEHLVKVDNQDVYQPITLANLLLAGFYVFVTIVSVCNFSGLMELLVFRRWSIEAGERYAVNQLAKYSLIALGFLSVAHELGGSWSEVQWLVAALGVGLGFGLQEIFANLVSGIILLFERPIRIGDTVTISDVTGKVSRIQMRATTLIDWDQKELIVPNKTFITSQLVNWSLSDPTTRIVIPIGIAYGSDVELAHRVMIETVKATPMVLSEPAPNVLFIGFGDSSLQFSIRAFVSDLANRLPVTHDLHVRLEKALRENHIEIPFPQREIHVRNDAGGGQTEASVEDIKTLTGLIGKGGLSV